MIRTSDPMGLETPISMIIFLSAILLISSSASVLLSGENESDCHDMRRVQAESLGRSLIRILEFCDEAEKDDIIETGTIVTILWIAFGKEVRKSSDQCFGSVIEVIKWNTEVPWTMVVFGCVKELPVLAGTATWTWAFSQGNSMRVYLPESRDISPPIIEVLI
jgi:hypothetical protein